MTTDTRISNTSWAYATAGDLWAGQEFEFYTAQEMYERAEAQAEAEMEAAIARRYGDCGREIVGTGDYEQLLAEEERSGLYGIPAPPMHAW
jgi:hypothetical protein